MGFLMKGGIMVKAIIGLQWGDEGKGRVIELKAKKANMVIRDNGGDNAGHTIDNEYGKTVLHLVPSGIFNPEAICIIGSGCVVHPPSLVKEIKGLNDKGIETEKRLFISRRAHIVTPWHIKAESWGIAEKLDTTRKGIGPCYVDKYARKGIMMECFLSEERLKEALNKAYRGTGRLEEVQEKMRVQKEWLSLREFLLPYIKEVRPMIWKAIDEEKEILCEGAQGFLLDIEDGTYPYCTSSHTGADGIYSGSGIPFGTPVEVCGVAKAYITRVGNGPFPTELHGKIGEYLQKKGNEFGATTGRPRRCGWLDIPLLRYACKSNGVRKVIITKLDVLDELEEIKICVGYEEGEVPEFFPTLENPGHPIYKTLPGWKKPTSECRQVYGLPREAQGYLRRIEELIGVRMSKASVGPKTEQIVEM